MKMKEYHFYKLIPLQGLLSFQPRKFKCNLNFIFAQFFTQ